MEICSSPGKGGLELYFATISNRVSHFFDVVPVIAERNQIEDKIDASLHTVKFGSRIHYFPLLTALKLAKLIDKQGVQVIHMHWNKDLTLAVLAKLISKSKPKLILMRHMQFPSKKDGLFHRFLYKNVDHIIAITHTMENDFKRFIPSDVIPEISVNYLGVEPIAREEEVVVQQRRKEYDPEGNLFLIGLVGRIDPYKGQDLLLDAMILAKEKQLPFKALIVGHAMKEEYLEALKQRVADSGLEGYIEFTGFVNSPRTLMQACDAIVLTTIEETFGLVLIEAMSVGVPVIGSDRGGVPEIIDHKRTGLLFKSGDSVALFEALSFLHQNPNQAKDFAKKALTVAQDKFSAEQHLNRMVQCLHNVVEGK